MTIVRRLTIFPNHIDKAPLLRTRVYEYLRKKIDNGLLRPGEYINIKEICEALDFSRSPVRDALLQLQTEGFITLLPQRGIRINTITSQELKDIYEMLGALESRVLKTVFPKIGPTQIARMKNINEKMLSAISAEKFNRYYSKNLDFHNVFLNLSTNELIKYNITILKQRLFEFSKRDWGGGFKKLNYSEHQELIDLIEKGDVKTAAEFWSEEHWSFNW